MWLRSTGLAVIALAVGVSSLTFSWVIEHRRESSFFPEFAGGVVYLSDILLLLGLCLWGMGWYLSLRKGLKYGPWYVSTPLLVLAWMTAFSILWAIDDLQAGTTTVRYFLLMWLYLVMVNEPARAKTPMIAVLLSVGVLQAVVAGAQVTGGSALGLTFFGELGEGALGYDRIGSPRAYGLGFNPNPTGLFLAVASLVAYSTYLLSSGQRWLRSLTLAGFVVIFAGLAATGSRSAFLGWSVGFLTVSTLAWLRGGNEGKARMRRTAIAILLVVASGASIQLALTGRASETIWKRLTPDALLRDSEGRMGDYEMSLPVIRDNLPLGVGVGNYTLALQARLEPTSRKVYTPVHNVPLLVLAELGVVGGAAWVTLMVAPLVWL